MNVSDVARGAKLAGLTALSACASSLWLRAPVLGLVGFQGWRVFAVLGAAAVGVIAVLMIGGWLPVGFLASTGFVLGEAWTEFWLSDVPLDLADSVNTAIINYGWEVLAPCVASVFASGFVIEVVVRRQLGSAA